MRPCERTFAGNGAKKKIFDEQVREKPLSNQTRLHMQTRLHLRRVWAENGWMDRRFANPCLPRFIHRTAPGAVIPPPHCHRRRARAALARRRPFAHPRCARGRRAISRSRRAGRVGRGGARAARGVGSGCRRRCGRAAGGGPRRARSPRRAPTRARPASPRSLKSDPDFSHLVKGTIAVYMPPLLFYSVVHISCVERFCVERCQTRTLMQKCKKGFGKNR